MVDRRLAAVQPPTITTAVCVSAAARSKQHVTMVLDWIARSCIEAAELTICHSVSISLW